MLSFSYSLSQELEDDCFKDIEKKVRPVEFSFGQSSTGCLKLNTREKNWSDIDQIDQMPYMCLQLLDVFYEPEKNSISTEGRL